MLRRRARSWDLAMLAGAGLVTGIIVWVALGSPTPWAKSLPLLPATELDGRVIYATNCATCHGARGEGQPNWMGSNPDGSYPPPPHDSSGHTWHHADGLLFKIVKNGGGYVAPKGFNSKMPAWGDKLTDAQIVAVLQYIKTLWGQRERDAQAKLSAGDPYPR